MLRNKRKPHNRVTKLYQKLIDSIHEMDWTIHHSCSRGCDGEVRPSMRTVHIRKRHRNTTYGCFVLAHEVGHMYDFIGNKYRFFFNASLPLNRKPENYKKEFTRQARLAERSAWKFGKRVLENHGLAKPTWYLSKEYFEKEWLPQTIDAYLSKPYWNFGA